MPHFAEHSFAWGSETYCAERLYITENVLYESRSNDSGEANLIPAVRSMILHGRVGCVILFRYWFGYRGNESRGWITVSC